MKHFFFLLVLPILSFSYISKMDSLTDFDTQLEAVATDFRTNIMDQAKCEAASKKAESIAEAIGEAMNEDGVSKTDLKKLEVLKKEAEAITDYISAVGDISGGFATVEKLNLANTRIKGDISSVQKGDFCTDIISVSIGDYICYLAENNSSKIISVNFKWKGPDGTKSGSGTIQVFANSIRAMYSNRKEPAVNSIKFMGMTCK